jgi:hypothetical protein
VHLVPKLLPDPHRPPRSWVEPHVVQQIIDNPRGVVRHFKCYRVESWAQEIALSVFLHFTIDGKTLYVEQTACVLPPIQAEYHMVDKLARSPLPGETFNLMLLALKDVPASLLRAPVDLLAILLSEHQEYRQYRRFEAQLNAGLPIDYGAETSVRHLAADEAFHNYFQELDHFRHRHIIELHTLTAILDFLESKHIDTGEFRARQTTILNSGIFMPGGSITDSISSWRHRSYCNGIIAGPEGDEHRWLIFKTKVSSCTATYPRVPSQPVGMQRQRILYGTLA